MAVRRTYKILKPPIVSDVIDVGLYGRIGLLKDNPTRVLKFCNPKNQDAVEALRQESKILSILSHHPNIILLHWASEVGLCFEYYPLHSLRSYYETLSPELPPLQTRVRWCCQAVGANSYIHSKNVVHNDISARNVLLSSELDIKICDFGFSCMMGEKMKGSAETRHCRERPSSDWFESCVMDDLFSLGSLFFEILMGYRPYDSKESNEIRQLFEERVFPSTEDIEPQIFGGIVVRCWNEEYRSIFDVQNDLPLLEDS
jgi:serine/threonine protein kinase